MLDVETTSAGGLRGRFEYLDVAENAWSAGEGGIAGEQCRAGQFGERDVGGVVEGQVLLQFPAALDQWGVVDASDPDSCQVAEAAADICVRHLAAPVHAAEGRRDLKVEQVWCQRRLSQDTMQGSLRAPADSA